MTVFSEPLVQLERVHAGYGENSVLKDVSLSIGTDQFMGIVGPSGAGKTTLLRVLLGTLRPSHGKLVRRAGLRISYVPQLETVNWDFPVTVFDCMLMGQRNGRMMPWASRAERAAIENLLERLSLRGMMHRHIRDLSGGQQQRMFLARALLGRPQLLVLDEPTSGIDTSTRHDILHLLLELNGEGIAIALTTHDLNGMAVHLPHLICINGHVVAAGHPDDVITSSVLEETYGARLEVLHHMAVPLVVDRAPTQFREVG